MKTMIPTIKKLTKINLEELKHRLYKAISRIADFIGDTTLQPFVWLAITLYCWFYDIDLSPFEKKQARDYSCLRKFFCRKFDDIEKRRPIATDHWVSPADGKVTYAEKVSLDATIIAKGQGFSPSKLVREEVKQEYHATTIYLSPKDYHRIHMPHKATLVSINDGNGEGLLRSVRPENIDQYPELYSENKRTVLRFRYEDEDKASQHDFFVVFVGALIVGKIVTEDDNESPLKLEKEINKGEQIGFFTFGSTVIMLTPKELCKVSNDSSEHPQVNVRGSFAR